MSANTNVLKNISGDQFFNNLKGKTCNVIYQGIFDYIKKVTQELTDEQPFYLLDLADILWKVQLWKKSFPNIKPYYAVKANPDPILMQLFVMLGLSFDCSTKGEIDLVLENGGNPKNIIYAHTIKPSSSLKYAAQVGIDFMTFDCKEELHKIEKYFPGAKLLLRVKPENSQCSFDLSIKYGCSITEAEDLLQEAKKLKLNVLGASFHVGALCEDTSSFTKSIQNCRLVFNVAQKLGFQFNILDLGAGFFGSTKREKHFYATISEIQAALIEYFPEKNIQIIAEPGCYFVGSSQKTINCVIGKKYVNSNISSSKGNDSIQVHYYLNDGHYGSFFKKFEVYDISPMPLLEIEESKRRPIYKSKIWGQTCCCEDVIIEECPMPDLEPGEYLVWENMGAYTISCASTFTLAPIPKAKYVFLKSSRLSLEWIENLEEVIEFISRKAILIENDRFP